MLIRKDRRNSWHLMLGALLGLLYIPIALERRGEGTARLEVATREGDTHPPARPTVLVGVDGSPEADQTLQTLTRALANSESELVLATVLDPNLVGPERAEQMRDARKLLPDRADRAATNMPIPHTEIAVGFPAETLIDVADARDVDIIAVGRGGNARREQMFGSVARHLVNNSRRAVLLGPRPQ